MLLEWLEALKSLGIYIVGGAGLIECIEALKPIMTDNEYDKISKIYKTVFFPSNSVLEKIKDFKENIDIKRQTKKELKRIREKREHDEALKNADTIKKMIQYTYNKEYHLNNIDDVDVHSFVDNSPRYEIFVPPVYDSTTTRPEQYMHCDDGTIKKFVEEGLGLYTNFNFKLVGDDVYYKKYISKDQINNDKIELHVSTTYDYLKYENELARQGYEKALLYKCLQYEFECITINPNKHLKAYEEGTVIYTMDTNCFYARINDKWVKIFNATKENPIYVCK